MTTKPTNHDHREAFASLFQAQYLQDSHTDVAAHETYLMRLVLLGNGSDDEVAESWAYVSPNSSRFNEVRNILERLPDNPTWGDYIQYKEREKESQ